MKSVILTIGLTVLGIYTIMIVNTLYGRLDKIMELESNLSSIVEERFEECIRDADSLDENMDAFFEKIAKELFVVIDTPADVTIDVLQYDRKKGILSVQVTLSYRHPNGMKGTISCVRHVILNRLQEAV